MADVGAAIDWDYLVVPSPIKRSARASYPISLKINGLLWEAPGSLTLSQRPELLTTKLHFEKSLPSKLETDIRINGIRY